MSEVLLLNACVIAGLMLTVWLISLPLRSVSIVDIAWGLGFVLVAWTSFLAGPLSESNLLLPLLTTVWGLRLSGYLAWRNIGKPEDYRYREMRNHRPRSFPIRSLLTVFALQGVLMWIIALPLQTVHLSGTSSVVLMVIGVLLWVTGFVFESVGDWQLARFKSDPTNSSRVMDRGLWRYTRHPNYFGDFLVWWGLYLIAAAGGAWWTVLSPILVSFLLIRVSGVVLLERSLKTNRPGYEDYVARTSSFFPWPPRQTPPDHVP
jgi:steroid 5-alpha reductase family enzyme